MNKVEESSLRPLFWVGSSKKELQRFPRDVQDVMGRALLGAQLGETPVCAKPLKGFKGAGVMEISDEFRGDAYRVVYSTRFAGAVYVLLAFKKKSKRGAETPRQQVETVRARYRRAERHYRERMEEDAR